MNSRFWFFLFLLGTPMCATNQVISYEPTVVEIVGHLELQTFPGPPNYESIQAGDAVERHFYLRPDSAVDVLPKAPLPTGAKEKRAADDLGPDAYNLEPEKNVKVMQLAIDGTNQELWNRFRKIGAGGHVKIRGTVFHSFTAHHHSSVLISVQKVEHLR